MLGTRWPGGVFAAEWEACAGAELPAKLEGLAVRRRDAAGPAGEDAGAPNAARALTIAPSGMERPFPFSDTKTYHFRAGHSGSLLVTVTAQIKGKHKWTFIGKRSHRSGHTFYYVRS